MEYKIEKNIAIGEFFPAEPKHKMWKIAKNMEIGDCITFDRRNAEQVDDMRMLKMFLHKLYGVVHRKKAVRPWTQKSTFSQSRVWRVDVQDKINEEERLIKMYNEDR